MILIQHGFNLSSHCSPLLIKKGFKIIGEYSCLGFDTVLTREGINKERPDKQDLENTERFIESILII